MEEFLLWLGKMQVGEGLWVLFVCSSLKCAAGWLGGRCQLQLGGAALRNIQSGEQWQLCPHELLLLKLVQKGRV